MERSKYFEEIRKLARENTKVTENGCWWWIGRARSGVYEDKYCKVRFDQLFSDGTRKRTQFYCHRLVYFGFNEILDMDSSLEISHLCGKRRCVNPAHLLAEENTTNQERRPCHNNNACSDYHSPTCITEF